MASESCPKSRDCLHITDRLSQLVKTLQSFGICAKSGKSVEHAEVLLVVETARLYMWGYAMGIIHTDIEPNLVEDLDPLLHQQPIVEVLQKLD